ncbi:Gfo/Idh/MocA family protein [Streptomyces sp. NPDC058374]|uniref:Gfo/Idh/MocA family protein n=1 Tax=Streptomyces sp. NPDC058374 TaxID=3346466 RepID=UPI003647456E
MGELSACSSQPARRASTARFRAASATARGCPAASATWRAGRLPSSRAPDFAIVAVPHHAGREVIETCAAAGVHVMKEKPFATSPAVAAELVALCDKAGIELMVTVQRRFHPVYTAAVQLLEQIGQPYLVEGRYTFADGALRALGRCSPLRPRSRRSRHPVGGSERPAR